MRTFESNCFYAAPSMAPRDVAALTLQAYGFPAGLLPLDKVRSFVVGTDGMLSVRLAHSVRKRFHGRSLKYASSISGKLEKGKLSRLSGICKKGLLLWVSIDSLQRQESPGNPEGQVVHMGNSQVHLTAGGGGDDIPVSAFT